MRKTFYVIAILAVLALICISCDLKHLSRLTENAGMSKSSVNATWIDVDWVMVSHDPAEITALAASLHAKDIHYVYVFTSYLKSDGTFNPTYAHAPEFVRILKATKPDLNVQAWIGLPLRQGLSTSGSTQVDLTDSEVRSKIATFCRDLVNISEFDGVHLDPEPVINGDQGLLLLLDDVRAAMGSTANLSIATRRIWPFLSEHTPPGTEKLAWSAPYYREVAVRVDQFAVMTYDSALPISELYTQWVRFQVIEISRAIEGLHTEFLVGLPTSEEETSTHRPNAENIESGLQGVLLGLRDDRSVPQAVTGVAIYPHWETDDNEWGTYERLWKDR